MNRLIGSAIALALAGAAFQAPAGVLFENVTIGGSLMENSDFDVFLNEVDFIFPLAQVGDGSNPSRSGTITITYEATGTDGTVFTAMDAGFIGEVSGSGQIFFNEVIENLEGNGGILGSVNALITDGDDLPFSQIIQFSESTSRVKVKKTFILDGIDTADFDLAAIDLVTQRLIPSAGTGVLLALAALPIARRRRN
jgi:hypothetical protein